MRVVMVSKALAVGAYQRKLEEIARLPGVELTAIVPSEWRDRRGRVTLERAHVTGYELIAAPLRFNGQYHLHFYPTLGRLLQQLHPDILHMDEEPYNLATWHALRLGQAVGARSLFFTWQNLNRRYPWPFRAFEAANYRRAAYAIAGNRAAVDVLRAKGYRGPAAVIPQFGVDPAIFAPPTEDQGRKTKDQDDFVLRPSSFVIGYAGALIPEKGVDLLLRACAGLPDAGWRLAIVGDGPERAQLGALAGTLGIGERVDFLGQRASTQMPDVYPDLRRAGLAVAHPPELEGAIRTRADRGHGVRRPGDRLGQRRDPERDRRRRADLPGRRCRRAARQHRVPARRSRAASAMRAGRPAARAGGVHASPDRHRDRPRVSRDSLAARNNIIRCSTAYSSHVM